MAQDYKDEVPQVLQLHYFSFFLLVCIVAQVFALLIADSVQRFYTNGLTLCFDCTFNSMLAALGEYIFYVAIYIFAITLPHTKKIHIH